MQSVVRPTLVAMATKFRLGTESNRLPLVIQLVGLVERCKLADFYSGAFLASQKVSGEKDYGDFFV